MLIGMVRCPDRPYWPEGAKPPTHPQLWKQTGLRNVVASARPFRMPANAALAEIFNAEDQEHPLAAAKAFGAQAQPRPVG